jgi:hypothetical protein
MTTGRGISDSAWVSVGLGRDKGASAMELSEAKPHHADLRN